MPSRRSRPGRVAALLLALAVVGSACTSADDGAGPTSTTDPEQSSGGPTTTDPTGTEPSGTEPDEDDPAGGTSPVQDGIRIEVVSSQPDRATGPDARIRVTPAKGGAVADLTVTVGDVDVTDKLNESDGRLEGVITTLVEGNNNVTATAGGASVTQRIRSWPLAGPMISGPHGPLLACSTEEHGLGAPADADCTAPTKVAWRYVSTDGTVKDLPDPKARPADLATATVDGEADVELIVRYEQGVVNRAVYEIASLDPTPGGVDSTQDDADWNRRLVYRFGDGCATTYGQGSSLVDVVDPAHLAQGYALATATFNTGAVQCNDVVSAETTMMVKERFIEEFGEPELTIGEGAGVGAAQINLITQNYPGLLDGAVALDPLPDIATVAGGIADCNLLNQYYRTPEGRALTIDQRTAVNGHATNRTCDGWERDYAGIVDPTKGCDPKIGADKIYDGGTNPGGVRCTFYDGSANQFGRDENSGSALRPLDNVGVQYGLEALNGGTISFEQFIGVNEGIGGFDLNGARQGERHQADPLVVQAAYETGRVSTGVGDQKKVPIIQVSEYDDPSGAVTDHFRAFSLRDRLTFGGPPDTTPGLRIWTRDPSVTPAAEASPEAVAVLDEWLTAMLDDPEGGNPSDALLRARPDEAVDNCLPAGRDTPISGPDLYEEKGPCRDDYPINGDPRIAAGAPRADDVIKCQRKPVDPSDYEDEITEAEFDELNRVFPEGVCDWAAAGVGQTTP
ncbi:MAG: hypothetical protein H0U29_06600, partial [Acidimicrobiia bacterium]|nr:hypothetical protein [Acidimicrobiia bacterium]